MAMQTATERAVEHITRLQQVRIEVDGPYVVFLCVDNRQAEDLAAGMALVLCDNYRRDTSILRGQMDGDDVVRHTMRDLAESGARLAAGRLPIDNDPIGLAE